MPRNAYHSTPKTCRPKAAGASLTPQQQTVRRHAHGAARRRDPFVHADHRHKQSFLPSSAYVNSGAQPGQFPTPHPSFRHTGAQPALRTPATVHRHLLRTPCHSVRGRACATATTTTLWTPVRRTVGLYLPASGPRAVPPIAYRCLSIWVLGVHRPEGRDVLDVTLFTGGGREILFSAATDAMGPTAHAAAAASCVVVLAACCAPPSELLDACKSTHVRPRVRAGATVPTGVRHMYSGEVICRGATCRENHHASTRVSKRARRPATM